MADLSAFRQAQSQVSRPGSKGWWEIHPLTAEQWELIHAAMDEPGIVDRAIAKVLADWGYDVTFHQVGHYRRTRRG